MNKSKILIDNHTSPTGALQTLVRGEDDVLYCISSVELGDVPVASFIDGLLGIVETSETMIFEGISEVQNGTIMKNSDSLWVVRPMNHQEGIEKAIKGGLKENPEDRTVKDFLGYDF